MRFGRQPYEIKHKITPKSQMSSGRDTETNIRHGERAKAIAWGSFMGQAIAWAARPVERKPQPDKAKGRPVANDEGMIFKPASDCKKNATLKAIGNFPKRGEKCMRFRVYRPNEALRRSANPTTWGQSVAQRQNMCQRSLETGQPGSN